MCVCVCVCVCVCARACACKFPYNFIYIFEKKGSVTFYCNFYIQSRHKTGKLLVSNWEHNVVLDVYAPWMCLRVDLLFINNTYWNLILVAVETETYIVQR